MDSYMEHAELNPLEVSGIPDLINLRILSNVRIRWIKANREVISAKIQACLDAKVTKAQLIFDQHGAH
eukprot:gene6666-7366_t